MHPAILPLPTSPTTDGRRHHLAARLRATTVVAQLDGDLGPADAAGPMAETPNSRETLLCHLLHRSANGDKAAEDEFWREIYPDLRTIAARALASWSQDKISFGITDLGDEALLRMLKKGGLSELGLNYFLCAYGTRCQQVLLDHYRQRRRRLEHQITVSTAQFVDLAVAAGPETADMDLERLLVEIAHLRAIDPDMGKVVDLKLLHRMTMVEIAKVIGVSKRKAEELWTFAKAHLATKVQGGGSDT